MEMRFWNSTNLTFLILSDWKTHRTDWVDLWATIFKRTLAKWMEKTISNSMNTTWEEINHTKLLKIPQLNTTFKADPDSESTLKLTSKPQDPNRSPFNLITPLTIIPKTQPTVPAITPTLLTQPTAPAITLSLQIEQITQFMSMIIHSYTVLKFNLNQLCSKNRFRVWMDLYNPTSIETRDRWLSIRMWIWMREINH